MVISMGSKIENLSKSRHELQTVVMLGSFAFGFMSFVLPIYSKKIGGDALSIGGLFSIFSLVTLLLRPLIGKGTDKYGRKVFFVAAFCFYGMSMLLFSYSTNILMLYMSRFVQAIGASFMWISAYSIVIDTAEDEKRGAAIGLIDGASSKGSFYGALIGFTIMGNFTLMRGWSILFKGYAILSIAAGYIAYRHIPETKSFSREPADCGGSELNHGFMKLLVIVFFSAISISMVSPLLMIYLQEKFTTDVWELSAAFVPAAVVYAFLPGKLGKVSDKYGRIMPLVIGLIASGIVSLCFPGVHSMKLLVVLWALESIGVVLASPAEKALVADMAGENIRGSAYGKYLFAASLGSVIGPLIGGWLYDSFGYAFPFYVNGITLLFDAILAIILLGQYRKNVQHEN